jgi:hypothetical protein
MGFFGPSKPKRITKQEYEQVMSRLYGKLDDAERVEVEKLFRADLDEGGVEEGITETELTAAIRWLNENKSKHVLEDDDIKLIVEYFEEHLKD